MWFNIVIVIVVLIIICVIVLCFCKNNENFPKIDNYRLGDCLNLDFNGQNDKFYKPNNLAVSTANEFPNSIIGYMVENKNKGNIYSLLREAVDKNNINPPRDEFVFHLRLGDKFMIIDNNNPKYDLPEVEDYVKIIPYMNKEKIHKVVLMGGLGIPRFQKKEYNLKSVKYRNDLKKLLESHGMDVVIKNSTADNDFSYLSNASNLVLGSGGFALTAGWVNPNKVYSFSDIKLDVLKKEAPDTKAELIKL